jgi:hypothetical protein
LPVEPTRARRTSFRKARGRSLDRDLSTRHRARPCMRTPCPTCCGGDGGPGDPLLSPSESPSARCA